MWIVIPFHRKLALWAQKRVFSSQQRTFHLSLKRALSADDEEKFILNASDECMTFPAEALSRTLKKET